MSNRWYIALYAAVVAMGTIMLFAGVAIPRVNVGMFVVPPLHDRPGKVLLVNYGQLPLGAVDSAEAYCQRCGMMWDMCRRDMAANVEASSKIYYSLPYSKTLFRLTGASVEKWQSVPDQGDLKMPDRI